MYHYEHAFDTNEEDDEYDAHITPDDSAHDPPYHESHGEPDYAFASPSDLHYGAPFDAANPYDAPHDGAPDEAPYEHAEVPQDSVSDQSTYEDPHPNGM